MKIPKVLILLLMLLPFSTAHGLQAQPQLPAPLYFVGAMQVVYRLETNGSETHAVTPPGEVVLGYDVSSADNRLVYVTGNELIVADPYGYEATILLSGGEPVYDDEGISPDWMLNGQISAPLWSPDGTQIAFVWGGLQIISAQGGEPRLVLPFSDRIYSPHEWSPDGSRLVASYFTLEGASGDVIVNLDDGAVTELHDEYGDTLCCGDVHWSLDGSLLFYSLAGGTRSGLWFIDANSGLSQNLTPQLSPNANTLAIDVIEAQQLGDGRLYFFMELRNPNTGGSSGVSMYRISDEGEVEFLREMRNGLDNVAWAPDGSGAVVSGQPLAWWPADKSNPYRLADEGSSVRWGR